MDAPASLSPRKRRAFAAISATAFLVLALAAFEGLSRYKFSDRAIHSGVHPGSEIVFDERYGWLGSKGFDGPTRHSRHPSPIHVKINSHGFRDEEWEDKLQRTGEDGKRILFLGDSVVYGWAVQKDERLSEQLAYLYSLRQPGRKVEVFNTGIPGYGPPNEYRVLADVIDRIRPHVVILLFVGGNDYLDTALPYHPYYALRVYRPFYDERGELVLNSTVPRRPSLYFSDTPLGGLYLWYGVDELYYLLQDLRYARYGIPTRFSLKDRKSLQPYGEEARGKFPQVERTVINLYARMKEMVRSRTGGDFSVIISPRGRGATLFHKLKERDIDVIEPPRADEFKDWNKAFADIHPNWLWAWLVAKKVYEGLEGVPFDKDFSEAPQLAEIPSSLNMADDSPSRFIFGQWHLPDRRSGFRLLGPWGALTLRNPEPGSRRVTVSFEVQGRFPGQALGVVDESGAKVCSVGLPVGKFEQRSCDYELPEGRELAFLKFLPEARDEERLKVNGQIWCCWFLTIGLRAKDAPRPSPR